MSGKVMTQGNLALNKNQVIVIDALEKPEVRKLRVAAYARVSSDSTDQLNSFMAQTNYYATLIASNENWSMVDIYADEGITGTSAEKRPDFQRLITDCQKGRVDKILVKSISRFARNSRDCLMVVRMLKDIGVGVHFEEQNIDTAQMSGELLTALFAAIAQKESESISQNMRWSYQQRMRNGTYVPQCSPYGYTQKDKQISIDEEKARVVRRIFDEYLAGAGTNEIAARLSADEIPCRFAGTGWSSTAVSCILTNEKYTGNALWQKYYTTDTLPYRKLPNRGERDAFYAQNTHDPIISEEMFAAVQELMRERRLKIRPRQNEPHPLRRKLRCGQCGHIFRRKVVRGITYWVCMGHDKQGSNTCDITQIPEAEIYSAFLRLYHKLRIHGEPILTQMTNDLQTIRERRLLWRADIVELNKRISDLNDQNRTLAAMNQHGLVDSDIFILQSNDLAQQLREAKREKEHLIGERDKNTITKTYELLELLDTMPEYLHDFKDEIFQTLVERITADSNDTLRFRLINGLEIKESIERTVRVWQPTGNSPSAMRSGKEELS